MLQSQAFMAFDGDRSGYIDGAELQQVLKTLGREANDEEVHEMMQLADGDGSGQIDVWEFIALMEHSKEDPQPEKTLSDAFRIFDINGDGTISAHELKRMMKYVVCLRTRWSTVTYPHMLLR